MTHTEDKRGKPKPTKKTCELCGGRGIRYGWLGREDCFPCHGKGWYWIKPVTK